MDLNQFKKLAESYNIIPVYETITADLITPVLAYIKLRETGHTCFLLESVEGIGRLARYSFIGKDPYQQFYNYGDRLTILENGSKREIKQNIFDYIRQEIASYRYPHIPELPDFTGGIVGYLGYENISLVEDVINFNGHHPLETPDSFFGIYRSIIAFDHYRHQILLINNVFMEGNDGAEARFNEAKNELKNLRKQLSTATEYRSNFTMKEGTQNSEPPEQFYSLVEKCKDNIFQGDVFQIVLSKRFDAGYQGDLLNVYRALRIINPSPYMYYMEFPGEFTIIGTSPEDLLKVKGNTATILPIAGTRRRGRSVEEDLAMEQELLDDPKEIAEHVMLVDLARNDLGRVSKYGSVKVVEKMKIHRFSHVMHIVSRVEGELEEGKDCIDALRASFPAGTVSGAPKIRAIQLLNDYESLRRNVYAGAVGYIDFSGNLDMCIAIRTLFAKGDAIYWQAGAGIVADSQPALELKEIKNKSAVLLNALHYAEKIDEDFSDR